MERSTMRSRVVGLAAAAALLASVGIANAADATANAKGPVKLTDNQLDKVSAGGAMDWMMAAVNANVAANVAAAAAVNHMVALNAATAAFANAAITP
jgi:hypothetical protein